MFKQEIKIDGKPHDAALMGKVTSFLQLNRNKKQKEGEKDMSHFYLNNASNNYHLK
jgi:hypothetical protein